VKNIIKPQQAGFSSAILRGKKLQ